MIEVKYISSDGKEYDLLGDRMRSTDGSFHDYEWEAIANERKIGELVTGFRKKAKVYSIILTVRGGLEERRDLIDALTDSFEHDIAYVAPGRIFFGDWYIECYIRSKITGISQIWNNWTKMELKVYCPHPVWIREREHNFKAAEVTSTNNKRYPYRYRYRYAGGLNNTAIVNEHYTECNFLLRIYGPCVKPSVYIGEHEYHVDVTLEAGEYLEIDSVAETVTKYMTSGIRVNSFHNRSFKNSVFQPIQTLSLIHI